MSENRIYLGIDLKSFYASVECAERGLNPLTTNLVVADESRTEKTICLAVSPSLKAYGIGGRPRLFEVVQRVREINNRRRRNAPKYKFTGKSFVAPELDRNPSYELDYIVAKPQMAKYMQVSTEIYRIYLRYIAPEDNHVYSIDEVFIDATSYLKTYNTTAHGIAMMLVRAVLAETGITATAGIGTNLFLCKVAMDILAKKMPADKDGVRIAELDEMSYRQKLWNHKPITDFWRVGNGIANRLAQIGIFTMGDIAECSVENEEILYKIFGVNAELLIDHAWGWEPCTIADIKAYKPESRSLSSGQVLTCPYSFEKGRLIVREMADLLALQLVEKRLVADQIVLTVGYDTAGIPQDFSGEFTADRYGRKMPKSAHGSANLGRQTSSARLIMQAVTDIYERIVNRSLMVRRMYVVANNVVPENSVTSDNFVQLDLFTDFEAAEKQREQEEAALEKEHNVQQAVLEIKRKYGKNAVLKGMNLEEGATTVERNGQVGGHKA